MMMAANLVGFVIGVDGVEYFMGQLFGTFEGKLIPLPFEEKRCLILLPLGLQFLFFACVCLFVAIQVMFEYRSALICTIGRDY